MGKREIAGPNRFEGLSRPASLQYNEILLGHGILGRLRWQDEGSGVPVRFERSDGYLLCLQRKRRPPAQRWMDGKRIDACTVAPGQFMLFDMTKQHAAVHYGAVDCVSLYTPRVALDRLHEEHGLPAFTTLRGVHGASHADGQIHRLMECVVPAFDHPDTACELFLDQVALAILAYLAHAYGERDQAFKTMKGGLAPWQQRRVEALLRENPRGELTLETLGRECGLSRAHFARSFKITTGKSPMAWLQAQRLARAQDLLAHTLLSLSEVAHACGYVDQSHLSRTFVKHFGTAPGEWRRLRRK